MICPICDAINKDNARICEGCGCRLNSRQPSRNTEQLEKKYLLAGAIALAAIVAFAVLMISSLSCICGGCSEGDTNAIVDSVDGEWDAESVSGSNVSAADTPSDDVTAETQNVEG